MFYPHSTTGFQESHTFLFSSYYPQGISCAAYDTQHSLLFIGGLSEESTNQADNVVMATNQGLTAWRDLSVAPYYKLVTDYDREYGQVRYNFILMEVHFALSLTFHYSVHSQI